MSFLFENLVRLIKIILISKSNIQFQKELDTGAPQEEKFTK